MPNIELIKAITDADLPLELADKSILTELKLKKPTYVEARALRSSREVLISENFARCQGIVFLNNCREIGALAHNHPSQDPHYTLTGAWTGGQQHLEDPKKIFSDLSKVSAVHMYHESTYDYPERWINGALNKIGIEQIIHIPIKSKKPGQVFWRDMALDVKDGSVYIFQTEFDYGIKYQPKKW